MRVLDRSKLTPWALVLGTDDQREMDAKAAQARRKLFTGATLTAEQIEAMHKRHDLLRADRAWLAANTPVGTVFDHLGAACMVVDIVLTGKDNLIHIAWFAHIDIPTPEGIDRRAISVSTLRAMLEPEFVAGGKS